MTTNPVPSERLEKAEHPVSPAGPGLYSRYIGAMLYFMGAALIAGAVVHYPIDPRQYSVICVVGAFVFLLGTVFNELVLAHERPNFREAMLLVVFSLLLSFGVGLVGGGIQHFTQFPERSALMTPIGLVMSFAAFIAKDTHGRFHHAFSIFGAGVLIVAGLTFLGMTALGNAIGTSGHDHGGHSHGGEPAPAVTVTPTPGASEAPIAPTPSASHDHSTHNH